MFLCKQLRKMTVTYTAQVATCSTFGCFPKLLLRWRGSVYKLVWVDLICYLFLYYAIGFIYRVLLNADQKKHFESISRYCERYNENIPLSFVLGFYVTVVMGRWWNQYEAIPWPDSTAILVSASIQGLDERGRLMRRTVLRYVCLCLTMFLTNIATRVKKRFPTLGHLVKAGLLTDNEQAILERFINMHPSHSVHWMPIVWATKVVMRARREGRIYDDFAVKTLLDELNGFRKQSASLLRYDTISIPLVYTQTVTLAVYSYFLSSLMGLQWLESDMDEGVHSYIDEFFPVYAVLQFFFYLGWLRVAEVLINPFGEDDEDFEVSWIIDRNLKVSYMIVDDMHAEHPELIKDQYWDSMVPTDLPYTEESLREDHPLPSTAKVDVSKSAKQPTDTSEDDQIEMIIRRRPTKIRMKSTRSVQSVHTDSSRSSSASSVRDSVQYVFSPENSRMPTPRCSVETTNSTTHRPSTLRVIHEAGGGTAEQTFVEPSPSMHSESLAFSAGKIDNLVATGETDGEANETATTHDDFENLRVLREKERSERQKQKLEQFTLINDQ